MTETTHDKDLDRLRADLARLRDEISALTADVKRSAESHAEQSHTETHTETRRVGEEGRNAWVELFHKFDSSRIQCEKVVRDLAVEVEHRPLVSIVAAFGLGFILAKLWYQETKK